MAFTPRSIFITGGNSGIGRGLAEEFHRRGSTVIIGGRNAESLAEVAGANPGMETELVDVADAESVYDAAARLAERHPGLDAVISNAGVQRLIDFTEAPVDPRRLDEEIDINFKGVLHVANAFVPLLRLQAASTLINVGSGLGFVPLTAAPIYSATKAAVHSFTVSLRHQLRDTGVDVVEVVPPAVSTNLHRGLPREPPGAMALDDFIDATVRGLDRGQSEVAVGGAKLLRAGSRTAPGRFVQLINERR